MKWGIYAKLAELLHTKDRLIKATKFINEHTIIRATRRLYHGRIRKNDNVEILFTEGRPNFKERKFIKDCKKAGEKFPIKKIQLKWLIK